MKLLGKIKNWILSQPPVKKLNCLAVDDLTWAKNVLLANGKTAKVLGRSSWWVGQFWIVVGRKEEKYETPHLVSLNDVVQITDNNDNDMANNPRWKNWKIMRDESYNAYWEMRKNRENK